MGVARKGKKNLPLEVCPSLKTPFWPKDGLHRLSDNLVLHGLAESALFNRH